VATFAQTTDGDLALDKGQLVLVTDVATEAAIVLRNRFKFVKGEYFLDTRVGMPYFGTVFVKNPNILLVRRVFRDAIMSVQGIKRIIDLNVTLDSKTRKLSFVFRAQADNGKFIVGGSGTPFVVEDV
jgi:hypothetical protein